MSDAWDGRPQNPDRTASHWVSDANGEVVVADWCAEVQRWGSWPYTSPSDMAIDNSYLGPCLTPDEITAREAASAEAIKRECARRFDVMLAEQEEARKKFGAIGSDARDKFEAWLDGDDTSALARALAAAEKRGMEKERAEWVAATERVIANLKAGRNTAEIAKSALRAIIHERNAAIRAAAQEIT